jgi:hypothetical protein
MAISPYYEKDDSWNAESRKSLEPEYLALNLLSIIYIDIIPSEKKDDMFSH